MSGSWGTTLSGWVDGAATGVSNMFNSASTSSFGKGLSDFWEWMTKQFSKVYSSPNSGSIVGGIAGGLLAFMGYNAFAEGGILGWLGLLLIPFGIIAGSAIARNSGWFGSPRERHGAVVQPERVRMVELGPGQAPELETGRTVTAQQDVQEIYQRGMAQVTGSRIVYSPPPEGTTIPQQPTVMTAAQPPQEPRIGFNA